MWSKVLTVLLITVHRKEDRNKEEEEEEEEEERKKEIIHFALLSSFIKYGSSWEIFIKGIC